MSVSFMVKAGSPFENVVTTWPLSTGLPQSSTSCITSDEGQPAGVAKLLARPLGDSASLAGVQPVAARVFIDAVTVVGGCTTSVIPVLRITVLENANVTSPV